MRILLILIGRFLITSNLKGSFIFFIFSHDDDDDVLIIRKDGGGSISGHDYLHYLIYAGQDGFINAKEASIDGALNFN